MSPEVIHCLKNEMGFLWGHFEAKYLNFSPDVKTLINDKVEKMLEVSRSIKSGSMPDDMFNALYYGSGDDSVNEFLQAMFDCFREWQEHEGLELKKSIYAHTNRSTDNWFPVVIIDQKINECELGGNDITLYRGCDIGEFDTQEFKQRQSWAKNLSIAKAFAFNHPSGNASLEKRVVIEALVNKNDILWCRDVESEIVLKLGFSSAAYTVAMTYDDYKAHN